MSIQHHPDSAMLLSYASGAADEAHALVIASHMALCAECRDAVADMERAGGALLEDVPVAALDVAAFDRVAARLGEQERVSRTAAAPSLTPAPLRSYIGNLSTVKWRKITRGIADYEILRRGRSVARLIRVSPGAGVAEHTHRGEELTLILTGGLFDHTGQYHRGDVQSTTPDILHVPTALPGEDCIVLAVTDAPLRFSNLAIGLFAKLMRF